MTRETGRDGGRRGLQFVLIKFFVFILIFFAQLSHPFITSCLGDLLQCHVLDHRVVHVFGRSNPKIRKAKKRRGEEERMYIMIPRTAKRREVSVCPNICVHLTGRIRSRDQ